MLNLNKEIDAAYSIAHQAEKLANALDSFDYLWNLLSNESVFKIFDEDRQISEWLITLDDASRYEKFAIEYTGELEKTLADLTSN